MEILVLTRHGSGRQIYREFNFQRKFIFEEYKSDIKKINGIYFNEIEPLIAIFSQEEKNYLYLENRVIDLTPDIYMRYYCGEKHEKSWIKIFEKESIIFELEYNNPTQEPYIDFVSGFEDWEVVNFAYHLAGYINKVHENPSVVLFPG